MIYEPNLKFSRLIHAMYPKNRGYGRYRGGCPSCAAIDLDRRPKAVFSVCVSSKREGSHSEILLFWHKNTNLKGFDFKQPIVMAYNRRDWTVPVPHGGAAIAYLVVTFLAVFFFFLQHSHVG
jgi:hypothetical protein